MPFSLCYAVELILSADLVNETATTGVGTAHLFYDLAVNNACCACRIGFIGIDVHCGSIACGNANNNAVKNKRTSGVELNLNDFLVGNAEVCCGFGGEEYIVFLLITL